ncbi:putative cupin superfamily protein [Endobacter medicaginis]|uniref:Cupin domain-containing protein n=1 Tax=Endobacter medicaginis TaxID=1181271 RepID=A0A850NXB6_9PROT|nr:cupin domain-containing protein [Endobacter medicaginis]MBB3175570.1 putative cupin superfamily protein [Endobacter medicaginis]MCX5477236.1 cupin domain-containing protein [Endobacter medicaginis]NVN30567.1 cupin domain-containing protein [Endobacter medicaginis]
MSTKIVPVFLEFVFPPGEASPLHVHADEQETFYLLSGAMRFWVGGVVTDLLPGQTLTAPYAVPHAYRVTSATNAIALVITTGGKFERMVNEIGRSAEAPGLPVPNLPLPDDTARLASIAEANGITILGSPPI